MSSERKPANYDAPWGLKYSTRVPTREETKVLVDTIGETVSKIENEDSLKSNGYHPRYNGTRARRFSYSSLDPEDNILLRPKKSEKNPKPISGDVLAERRGDYLADPSSSVYDSLMNQAREVFFWNEIGAIAQAHRPDAIVELVKKRFGKGERRYTWDLVDVIEEVHQNPSSPYKVLDRGDERDFIQTIIRKSTAELDQVRELLGEEPSQKGYLKVYGNSRLGRIYFKESRSEHELEETGYSPKQIEAILKTKPKNIFVSLAREEAKHEYIRGRLHTLQSSCKAVIGISYVLFAAEFMHEHYEAEIERVIKSQSTSKRAKKREEKQLVDLGRIIDRCEENIQWLKEGVVYFKNMEKSAEDEEPKFIRVGSERVNKSLKPNGELKRAIKILKKMGAIYLEGGNHEAYVTVRTAMSQLDPRKDYPIEGVPEDLLEYTGETPPPKPQPVSLEKRMDMALFKD